LTLKISGSGVRVPAAHKSTALAHVRCGPLGSYGGGQRQEVGQGQGCMLDKGLPRVMESTSDSPFSLIRPLSLGWIRICCGLIYWQSNGKAKKFSCAFLQL